MLKKQTGLVGLPARPPVMEEHKPGLTGTVLPTGIREFRSINEAYDNMTYLGKPETVLNGKNRKINRILKSK